LLHPSSWKIAAVVVGLFVAALAYLSYRGWVDVKWVAMEDASRNTLTNTSEQVVHALNNTATQIAAHASTLAASGLAFHLKYAVDHAYDYEGIFLPTPALATD